MSYLGQELGQGKATRATFTAVGGETSVATNYTPGQLSVYLNGVKLVDEAKVYVCAEANEMPFEVNNVVDKAGSCTNTFNITLFCVSIPSLFIIASNL